MTQLNTPYPATAYLTGFLRQHAARLGVDVTQADPALELFLRLFSRDGLDARRRRARESRVAAARRARGGRAASRRTPRPTPTPSTPSCASCRGAIRGWRCASSSRAFLPEGRASPRSTTTTLARGRSARSASTIARATSPASTSTTSPTRSRDGIDPRFELSRYGERLAASAPTFDPLHAALEGAPTLVDAMLDELAAELVATHRPDLVGLTVPFPGNVYGAFRIARAVKAVVAVDAHRARRRLRQHRAAQLAEPRVFDYVDYITLDDGERPLLALIEHLADANKPLLRTFVRDGGARRRAQRRQLARRAARATAGTPTYDGLPLDRYLSLFEMLNPMHRLWSSGRWNKLTIAHGCYWKKCTFCDITLDYIARYDLGRRRSARRSHRGAHRRDRRRPASTSSTRRRRRRGCARSPSG